MQIFIVLTFDNFAEYNVSAHLVLSQRHNDKKVNLPPPGQPMSPDYMVQEWWHHMLHPTGEWCHCFQFGYWSQPKGWGTDKRSQTKEEGYNDNNENYKIMILEVLKY